MKWLCRLGIHHWSHWYRVRNVKGGANLMRRKCLSCPTIDTHGDYDV